MFIHWSQPATGQTRPVWSHCSQESSAKVLLIFVHQLSHAPAIRVSRMNSLTSSIALPKPRCQVPHPWVQLPRVMLAVKIPPKRCHLELSLSANTVRAVTGTGGPLLPLFGRHTSVRAAWICRAVCPHLDLDVNQSPGPLHILPGSPDALRTSSGSSGKYLFGFHPRC